jgi:hypothetical protein
VLGGTEHVPRSEYLTGVGLSGWISVGQASAARTFSNAATEPAARSVVWNHLRPSSRWQPGLRSSELVAMAFIHRFKIPRTASMTSSRPSGVARGRPAWPTGERSTRLPFHARSAVGAYMTGPPEPAASAHVGQRVERVPDDVAHDCHRHQPCEERTHVKRAADSRTCDRGRPARISPWLTSIRSALWKGSARWAWGPLYGVRRWCSAMTTALGSNGAR